MLTKLTADTYYWLPGHQRGGITTIIGTVLARIVLQITLLLNDLILMLHSLYISFLILTFVYIMVKFPSNLFHSLKKNMSKYKGYGQTNRHRIWCRS